MDITKHAALAAAGDVDAMNITLQATRDVFELKPFDTRTELGLTDMEVMGLMTDFGDFTTDVKKNGNGQQTWPDVTVPQSSGQT
jgi:hypothetical protein